MSSGIQYRFSCHCQANIYTLTVPDPSDSSHHSDGPSAKSDGSDGISALRDHDQADALPSDSEGEEEVGRGIDEITVCDCSFCTKRLLVWSRQPDSRVEFNRGCIEGREGEEGTVDVYLFGQENLANHWCTKCGTYLYGIKSSEPGYIYLNLRALREPFFSIYDLPTSRVEQLEYADSGPIHRGPVLPDEVMRLIEHKQAELERDSSTARGHGVGSGGGGEERGKERGGAKTVIHTGSCHCQQVVFGYIGKGWEEEKNGNVWTGDPDDHIFFAPSPSFSPSSTSPTSSTTHPSPHRPPPHTVTRYIFSPTSPSPNQHVFCNACGCQVIEIKEDNQTARRTLGVNVACFEGAGRYLGDGGRGELVGKGEWGGVRVNREPRGWKPAFKVDV